MTRRVSDLASAEGKSCADSSVAPGAGFGRETEPVSAVRGPPTGCRACLSAQVFSGFLVFSA